MGKRYKVKYPVTIETDDIWIYNVLHHGSTKVVESGEVYRCGMFPSNPVMFTEIPKEWLEEIIETPKTASDIVQLYVNDVQGREVYQECGLSIDMAIHIAKLAEANNELRLKPLVEAVKSYIEFYSGPNDYSDHTNDFKKALQSSGIGGGNEQVKTDGT